MKSTPTDNPAARRRQGFPKAPGSSSSAKAAEKDDDAASEEQNPWRDVTAER